MTEPLDMEKVTIADLFKVLGLKDMALLLNPDADSGVVVAQGRGLKHLVKMIQERTKVNIADDADEFLKERYGDLAEQAAPQTRIITENVNVVPSTDEDLQKTLAEIRAEIKQAGFSVITRSGDTEDERFISVVATGEAAQMLFALLDATGIIEGFGEEPSRRTVQA